MNDEIHILSRTLSRLTHDLKNPIIATLSALELMRMEFEDRGIVPEDFFSEDYLGDVQSYCIHMRRLLKNADLSDSHVDSLSVHASLVWLMKDVITPAVKDVNLFLRERAFDRNCIVYGRFEQIPRLWVDREDFQQVIFNLLSNAINFAVSNPRDFRVLIDGIHSGSNYIITVQDWGRGIDENEKEAIFQEGVRGRDAYHSYVAGQGIGLSVARRIIEAHGGAIGVTNLHRPTEVSISLPESLARRPPGRTDEVR